MMMDVPAVTGLRVGPSLIPGAGLGVFATRYHPKGSTVAIYYGDVMDADAIADASRPDWDIKYAYSMELAPGVWIDALRHPTCIARYLNDNIDRNKYNVTWVRRPALLIAEVVALRDIEAGEEVYVSYGDEYWTGPHKISPAAGQEDAPTVTA